MNDDSRLDCSDYPCAGCGHTQGDCCCTPEQVEQYIAQHRQPAICPNCGRPVFQHVNGGDYNCVVATCLWSGKLQASA